MSCPTEALFLQRLPLNRCYPRDFAKPSRLKVPLRPQLTRTVSAIFSAKASTKFSEIS